MNWKPGQRLIHRHNPELGPGVVLAVEDRTLVVEFPGGGTVLRLSSTSDAVAPLEFRIGARARVGAGRGASIIESFPSPGRARLDDGREVDVAELWPATDDGSLVDRLALGEVEPLERFGLRLDALQLAEVREADGLGSFLGGRIRIFPHQLYAAERATRADPVRWLLADEVGLGKTVEACLVLNHLLRTGRAERTLVVAPSTLTVQWLGELWRKYHQVFVLLDEARLQDVERDYGRGFNPFDAHHQAVIGMELLVSEPRLARQATEAGIDLLIVDEAHHLRRPAGHPGNPSYRAIRPIADQGRHVLLLTATPLDDDAQGFFRLLQILRPEEFPEGVELDGRLESGEPLPPCTSATRRSDIGGLPPRIPAPVELPDEPGWSVLLALEQAVRSRPGGNAAVRRAKARRVRRALASGPALAAVLDANEAELRQLCLAAEENDPRIAWLAERAADWRRAGDKTLVFVAQRETLDMLRTAMSRRAQLRVGVFHEELSPGQRDIEVAQFRLPGGPSMLVSTECGGEGRNFEFCTRLVLFDLPWNPMTVEQRIGRLDRIGRGIPVESVYFRPPRGVGRTVCELFESLGLFRRPLGGLERELAGVERAIEAAALDGAGDVDASRFEKQIREAREGWDRIRRAAHHEMHRDPYRPELADSILSRIPDELESLTADVVLAACEQLGLDVEPSRGETRYGIELGTRTHAESLPGVAGGSSFLGTFRRIHAVEDESIDFFASGHPLVEGLLARLEENDLGRVGLLQLNLPGTSGFGLAGWFARDPGFEIVAIDAGGARRDDWERALRRRPLRSRRVRGEGGLKRAEWPALVRGLARRLEGHGRLLALAALFVDAR